MAKFIYMLNQHLPERNGWKVSFCFEIYL